MGNKCICLNSQKEPEIDSTQFIDSKSNLQSEEKAQQPTLKSKSKPQTAAHEGHTELFKIILDKLSENNFTAEEISKEDFDKVLDSYPQVKRTIESTSNQMSEMDKEKENNSSLTKLPSVHITKKDTNEDSYFEGYSNSTGDIEYGSLLTKNGHYYKGNLSNYQFNGKGLYISPNGDYSLGDWENGESKGKGELVLQNGTKYVGDFVSNMKNGTGKENNEDGSVYEGNYVNNEKDGKGTITYKDGSVYRGDIVKGEMTGKGEYTWGDGRKYEGDFVNGNLNGKGKIKKSGRN